MDTNTPVIFEQRDSVTFATVLTACVEGMQEVNAVVWALEERVVACPRTHLLLDFHCVSRVSTDFLFELAALRRTLEMGGGTLRLCALRQEVLEILGAFGLKRLYLGDDAEDALPKYLLYLRLAKTKPRLPHLQRSAIEH